MSEGRAPKNDQALFVLAKLCSQAGDGRLAAWAEIPNIARTFTHLSHFVHFIKKGKMRGWGRGFRRAVANWYNSKSIDDLVYQAIKYQSRDGWSQKDVAVLSHVASFLPDAERIERSEVFHYLNYKRKGSVVEDTFEYLHPRLNAVSRLATAESDQEAARIITEFNLPMEAVPTDKRGKEVYRAVCEKPNMGWLVRNLGNLSKVELLSINEPEFVSKICATLTNEEQIKKSRLHPLSIFVALNQYQQGKSAKGSGTWVVVPKVLEALTEAFHKSFKFVEPSNKRIMYAVDVSGSMQHARCSGIEGLHVHQAAGLLALASAKVEPNFVSIAFDFTARGGTGVYPISITANQRLDDVVRMYGSIAGGGTDCSLPFRYAIDNNLKIDTFVCFTDSETWAGNQHVMPALLEYRRKSGIAAKAINIAMVLNRSTNFNADPRCIEVSGFDTTIPQIISEFSRD
ncbi:MAG: TROVE domain-containing protein [Candidatus Obscuribacterales bacterium]|nr:TROVE domain-containing protein [Candidatus Obscuribacterales bacterium]